MLAARTGPLRTEECVPLGSGGRRCYVLVHDRADTDCLDEGNVSCACGAALGCPGWLFKQALGNGSSVGAVAPEGI